MPRDLGKAKRADLTGKFPGEQAEYGSALARFLESAGQLKPLTEGTYLESSGNGNGNGHETEIPRGKTDTGRGKDTEVAPAPDFAKATSDRPGGNGRFGTDTVFETPLENAFDQEEMFPDAPTMELELSPEPAPGRKPEPQSLDSVPDLLSPELDSLGEEPEDETELLGNRARPAQDIPPPEHSEDTGMLIAEAFSTRKEDGWDVELDNDDEEERKITDKLNRRPEGDEDLTSVLSDEHPHDEEKITNKVEPRRDVDPRMADPNAVVRDTVNFYNQTQSFQEQRKGSSGFPTISPNVVNSGQPLGLRDDLTDRAPRPIEPFESAQGGPASLDADEDTDTLRPGPALSAFEGPAMSLEAEPTLGPDDEPDLGSLEPLDEVDNAALGKLPVPPQRPVARPSVNEPVLSPEPILGPDLEPTLSDVAELSAEAEIDEADKRETDKFTQEDREPPQLPLPEGTDKLDKSQAPFVSAQGRPPIRKADRAAQVKGRARSDVERLEPLADERVAAGKDTQRFYVAEILAKKSAADSTAELQPAEEGPPPEAARAKGTGETSSDYSTDSAPAPRKRSATRRDELRAEEEALPQPKEVHTDFIEHVHVSASERIIPELDEDDAEDGDDTVDEEAAIDERSTDKLRRAHPRTPVHSAPASARARPITDSVSQRLKQERIETLRLIEQAEAVAVRLREASDASRSDLVALSARRETIRATRPQLEDPAETVFDPQPAETVAVPAAVLATGGTTVVPTARATPRVAERVPTRAIGEIVSELQRSVERGPASLSALLDQVSRKPEPTGGNGNHRDELPEDDDIDLLVAASSRLRETVESAGDEDRISGRMPVLGDAEGPAPSDAAGPASRESGRQAPSRREPDSSLSGDLDRLWQVLDSRRATPVSARAETAAITPATLLIPAADKARITPREPELDEGWTQEMLWPTLAGIAVVTFALGAVFVWVLVRALG